MNEDKLCSSCNWWTDSLGDNGIFKACVFLNGIKGSQRARVRCKGILLTHPDFGCSEWDANRRTVRCEP